jgi:hypothetical protein
MGKSLGDNTRDCFGSDREREEGHTDTCAKNIDCGNKHEPLGCEPGINAAGKQKAALRTQPGPGGRVGHLFRESVDGRETRFVQGIRMSAMSRTRHMMS